METHTVQSHDEQPRVLICSYMKLEKIFFSRRYLCEAKPVKALVQALEAASRARYGDTRVSAKRRAIRTDVRKDYGGNSLLLMMEVASVRT